MKKILFCGFLIMTLLAGTLTGCGKEEKEETSVSSNAGEQTNSQPQLPAIITASPEGGNGGTGGNDESGENPAPQLPSLFSHHEESIDPSTETRASEAPQEEPAETQQQGGTPVTDPATQSGTPGTNPQQAQPGTALPYGQEPAATPAANPAQPATPATNPQQPATPATNPQQQAAPATTPQQQTAPSQPNPSWPGSNFMPTPSLTPAPAAPAPAAAEEMITIYGGIQAPAADFVFPHSSTQRLTDSDLQYLLSLSARDMHFEAQLAISEIYARYGYTFTQQKETSQNARNHFENKDWYISVQAINPTGDQETLRWHYFNDIERDNVQILLDFQNTYDHYTS